MVLENHQRWYADDGQLTKQICEQTERDVKFDPEDCCACDEAKYKVQIALSSNTSMHFLFYISS